MKKIDRALASEVLLGTTKKLNIAEKIPQKNVFKPDLKVIFLVDDDLDDRQFFVEAIRDLSNEIRCVTAENGEQALKMLKELRESPDYIFLDVNMPFMNGKQCLKQIKQFEKFKKTPVVMLTTSSEEADINESKRLGASLFLTKPHSYHELKTVLESVLFKQVNK